MGQQLYRIHGPNDEARDTRFASAYSRPALLLIMPASPLFALRSTGTLSRRPTPEERLRVSCAPGRRPLVVSDPRNPELYGMPSFAAAGRCSVRPVVLLWSSEGECPSKGREFDRAALCSALFRRPTVSDHAVQASANCCHIRRPLSSVDDSAAFKQSLALLAHSAALIIASPTVAIGAKSYSYSSEDRKRFGKFSTLVTGPC